MSMDASNPRGTRARALPVIACALLFGATSALRCQREASASEAAARDKALRSERRDLAEYLELTLSLLQEDTSGPGLRSMVVSPGGAAVPAPPSLVRTKILGEGSMRRVVAHWPSEEHHPDLYEIAARIAAIDSSLDPGETQEHLHEQRSADHHHRHR